MEISLPELPFDPTGTLSSNKIQLESHSLSPPLLEQYYFIIPRYAPFFRDTLIVKNVYTKRELKEGVDWLPGHKFLTATTSVAKPVYGSIVFFDREFKGEIEISYQALGGNWSISQNKISEIIVDALVNPRITTWDSLLNVPLYFPPIKHKVNLTDLTGVSEVRDAIDRLTEAVLSLNQPTVKQHVDNKFNPHEVTKEQVGLDLVENFSMASVSDAISGSRTDKYMSPYHTELLIESKNLETLEKTKELFFTKTEVLELLNKYVLKNEESTETTTPEESTVLEHINLDLAHKITKEQLKLDNLTNVKKLTVSDVESIVIFYITNSINENVPKESDELNIHLIVTNPHGDSKGSLNLDLVENTSYYLLDNLSKDVIWTLNNLS